jgi:hypothetical protein
MADTNILVTSATAVGGVQQIVHKATTDFAGGGCLTYLALIGIEVWSAASNNRAAASKVGEITPGGQFVQTGLGRNVTRWSWYRARDASDNLGDFWPVSATAGIAATTSNQVPPAGSVGPEQTASNFATLSALSANLGTIIAGLLQAVTVESSTITGNTIRTANSGRRIEMTALDNFIRVRNGAGQTVASLGEFTLVPGWTTTLLSVIIESVNAAVAFQNTGTGPALVTMGQLWSRGNGNKGAFRITHDGVGADAHGIWFDIGPTSNQGGAGVLGVSQAGGGYCLYMNRGGIGPFTGAHPGMIAKDDVTEIGDIVIDRRVLARIDIDNTVTEVERSRRAGQLNAIGVVSRRVSDWSVEDLNLPPPLKHLAASHDYAVINALGEGQINVCGEAGNLEPGDFICVSGMPGKGMRLDPDTPLTLAALSSIVARVREPVTFSSASEWKRVACIYLCG